MVIRDEEHEGHAPEGEDTTSLSTNNRPRERSAIPSPGPDGTKLDDSTQSKDPNRQFASVRMPSETARPGSVSAFEQLDPPNETSHHYHLRRLVDDVRACLQDKKELGPRSGEIMKLLGETVKNECERTSMIELSTISIIRLDKLLENMIDVNLPAARMSTQFRAHIAIAESLQRQWRARFGEPYFALDQNRFHALSEKGGRLEDVVFNKNRGEYGNFWIPKQVKALSEKEGNDKFKPGHWWLNLACAHRDGIVCCGSDEVSQAKYGLPTLPLMVGVEEEIGPNRVSYTREGSLDHMCLPVLKIGFDIRVLRGHLLKSPLAPKAGVRYDGNYIIRSYSQRRNPDTNIYTLKLELERVHPNIVRHTRPIDGGNSSLTVDQCPMNEVMKVPRPSELDDWQLFETVEENLIGQILSDPEFLRWKLKKAQDRAEAMQFRQALGFEAAISLAEAMVRGLGIGAMLAPQGPQSQNPEGPKESSDEKYEEEPEDKSEEKS